MAKLKPDVLTLETAEHDIGTALRAWSGDERAVLFTKGLSSIRDLISWLLRRFGPAEQVDLSIWSFGLSNGDSVNEWIERGQVGRVRWLVDPSCRARQPGRWERLLEWFSPEDIRLCQTHAKVFRVLWADREIAITSSANLNHNPRFEWLSVEVDPPVVALVAKWFDREFDRACDITASEPAVRKEFKTLELGGSTGEKVASYWNQNKRGGWGMGW